MQIDPLVKPRSIAIVGATDRVGPARSVIESLGAGPDAAVSTRRPELPALVEQS